MKKPSHPQADRCKHCRGTVFVAMAGIGGGGEQTFLQSVRRAKGKRTSRPLSPRFGGRALAVEEEP